MALAKLGEKNVGLWLKTDGDKLKLRDIIGLDDLRFSDKNKAFSAAGVNTTLVRSVREYEMLADPKAYYAQKITAEQKLFEELDKQYDDDYKYYLKLTGDATRARGKAYARKKNKWDMGLSDIQEEYPSIDKAIAALQIKRKADEKTMMSMD